MANCCGPVNKLFEFNNVLQLHFSKPKYAALPVNSETFSSDNYISPTLSSDNYISPT